MYLANHHLRLLQRPPHFRSLNPLLHPMPRKQSSLLSLESLAVSLMHRCRSQPYRRYLESLVVRLMHQCQRHLPIYLGSLLSRPPSLYLGNPQDCLKLHNRLLLLYLRKLVDSLMDQRRSQPHRQYLVSLKHQSRRKLHPLYSGIPAVRLKHRHHSQSPRFRSALETTVHPHPPPRQMPSPSILLHLKRPQQAPRPPRLPQIIFSVLDNHRLPQPQARMHLDSQINQLRVTRSKMCMSIILHRSRLCSWMSTIKSVMCHVF